MFYVAWTERDPKRIRTLRTRWSGDIPGRVIVARGQRSNLQTLGEDWASRAPEDGRERAVRVEPARATC
jgi:hypothetical protein